MSHIDEALRRAREQRGGERSQAPEDVSVPWEFGDHRPADTTSGDRQESRLLESQPAAPLGRDVPLREPEPPKSRRSSGKSASGVLGVFQGFSRLVAEKLVVTPETAPSSVEQYRKIAATLHHAQSERGIRSVLVASAMANEGKTLTSTNLALTLSESFKRRVLLIDADLRRPSLHEVFQLPNVSGLGDGLQAEKEEKLSVIQVSSCLSVLTAGRPTLDPMSGLTSDRMRRILEEAVESFDWVIIDTPPVALLPDANLLAAMVDTAVLVVSANHTPYPIVQQAVDAIGRDRILGVVLNRVDPKLGPNAYNYRGYAYGGYGRQTTD